MRAQAIVDAAAAARGRRRCSARRSRRCWPSGPCRVVLLSRPVDARRRAARRPSARAARHGGERRCRRRGPPRASATAVLSARDGRPRRGDPRLDARARRRAAGRRRPARRAVRRRRGRAALRQRRGRRVSRASAPRAPRPRRPPRPRLARAVRDRLHVGRQRDLLLARRHRRPRARADAVRLPASPASSSLLAAMTYVEGASLHQDRGGSTVFARYAFNELVELRRRLGDPPGLHHPRSPSRRFSATNYLAAFWSPLGDGERARSLLALGDHRLRRDPQRARLLDARASTASRRSWSPTSALQVAAHRPRPVAFFDLGPARWTPIDLGSTPTWDELVFALGVATVVFTGLESASGLAGEVAVGAPRARAWSLARRRP